MILPSNTPVKRVNLVIYPNYLFTVSVEQLFSTQTVGEPSLRSYRDQTRAHWRLSRLIYRVPIRIEWKFNTLLRDRLSCSQFTSTLRFTARDVTAPRPPRKLICGQAGARRSSRSWNESEAETLIRDRPEARAPSNRPNGFICTFKRCIADLTVKQRHALQTYRQLLNIHTLSQLIQSTLVVPW